RAGAPARRSPGARRGAARSARWRRAACGRRTPAWSGGASPSARRGAWTRDALSAASDLEALVLLEGLVRGDARARGMDGALRPAQEGRARADGGGPARDLVA